MSLNNKPVFFGAPLVGVCLAVLISVPLSAFLASGLGDTYNTRVAVYGGLLLWIVSGAISVFLLSRESTRSYLSLKWFFLWFISTWLWPIPLWMYFRKKSQKKTS